jgi:hypothetical protein
MRKGFVNVKRNRRGGRQQVKGRSKQGSFGGNAGWILGGPK